MSDKQRKEGARWWHTTDDQQSDAQPIAPQATGSV
jgi:hypothetical protein